MKYEREKGTSKIVFWPSQGLVILGDLGADSQGGKQIKWAKSVTEILQDSQKTFDHTDFAHFICFLP